MPNTEPLAAILAKYRKDIAGGQFFTPTQEYIMRLLDRIEAAAERERIELREDEAKMLLREYAAAPDESLTPSALELKRELLRLAPAPGNAAALREALEGIEDDCRVLDRKDMWEEEGECYYDALRDIREKVNAALATPARNCDICRTKRVAKMEYDSRHNAEYGSKDDFIDWLFRPAEGGAE